MHAPARTKRAELVSEASRIAEQPSEQPNRRAAADNCGPRHRVEQEDQAADQRPGTDS
jgi:hypothetical protein